NILHNTFSQNRTYEDVGALGKVIEASKDAAAISAYNRLVDLLVGVQNSATKKGPDPYADRAKQLDEREQSLADQDKKNFFSSVPSEAENQVTRSINSQLATQNKAFFDRGGKLDTETRNRLMSDIRSVLINKVHSEPTYSKQQPAVM